MQGSSCLFHRKVVPHHFLQVHIWLLRNRNLASLLQRQGEPSKNGDISNQSHLQFPPDIHQSDWSVSWNLLFRLLHLIKEETASLMLFSRNRIIFLYVPENRTKPMERESQTYNNMVLRKHLNAQWYHYYRNYLMSWIHEWVDPMHKWRRCRMAGKMRRPHQLQVTNSSYNFKLQE